MKDLMDVCNIHIEKGPGVHLPPGEGVSKETEDEVRVGYGIVQGLSRHNTGLTVHDLDHLGGLVLVFGDCGPEGLERTGLRVEFQDAGGLEHRSFGSRHVAIVLLQLEGDPA